MSQGSRGAGGGGCTGFDENASYSPNCFDVDQCTGHADHMRPDIVSYAVAHGQPAYGWNAYVWASRAAAVGFPVDSTPRAGDIAVFPIGAWGSSVGHVAYVESVGGDGSYTVSEDNFGYSEWSNGSEEPGYPDGPDPSVRTIGAGQSPAGTSFIHRMGGAPPPPPTTGGPPPPPPPPSSATTTFHPTGAVWPAGTRNAAGQQDVFWKGPVTTVFGKRAGPVAGWVRRTCPR